MSKHILKTMRMPMSGDEQTRLAIAMQAASQESGYDSVVILCQPRIQAKEWQIAFISPEFHGRIQAVLDEAKK